MDSFDECGIRYLTPSSINAFRDNPAYWVMRFLYGVQTTSPAFIRSIAVKAGVKSMLYERKLGHAEDRALETFQHRIGVSGMDWEDPGVQDEYDNVLPMFDLAVKALDGLGLIKMPTAMDMPTHVWADGVTAPFLSSPDIVYEDCVVDLKPTKRCPSKLPFRDLAAMAIHSRAREGVVIHNIYATNKKYASYAPLPSQLDEAWADLVTDAFALQTFVFSAESREHALAMTPLNRDHFYWSDESLEKARSILKLTQERMHGLNNAAGTRRLRAPGTGDPFGDMLPDH